jgi:mRNA-degrading endonuclease RelE of RelBE toxin-antitoxin system
MDTWRVELSREAAAAVGALGDEDRRVVDQAIRRLTDGPNPPGVPESYRLRGEPASHVLRAGGRFRIVYTATADGLIIVSDVVNHDSVREYFTPVGR